MLLFFICLPSFKKKRDALKLFFVFFFPFFLMMTNVSSFQDGLKPGEFFRSWVSESKKPQIQEMLNEERDRRNKPQHWQQVFILFCVNFLFFA